MHTNKDFCYHQVSDKNTSYTSHYKLRQRTTNFVYCAISFPLLDCPNTSSNRKSLLIFLRLLQDKANNPLYTYEELSVIMDSKNRQASSNYMEHFPPCGNRITNHISLLHLLHPKLVGQDK